MRSADPHVDKALEYCADVVAGKILACLYVRQACKRQLRDLRRFKRHALYYWDERRAGRACRFIECLRHIKGPKAAAKEKIVLEGWQCFVVVTIFGWRRKDTGGRRFRTAYVEVPRGNAKSTLASGIGLFGLTSDEEAGAEVYSAATTREQSKIVFDVARSMMLGQPEFADKLGVVINKDDIQQVRSNSKFTPLSREAKSLDGKNVHIALIDELHAHPTREVYDVLETAMSKRLASLLFIITTAGTNTSGICYEQRTYSIKVLEGTAEDETRFAVIYTADEGDDWTALETWKKANPNWGVSVMPDQFASLAMKAEQLPSAQSNFKTKHLNLWQNADVQWMDLRAWDRCADVSLDIANFWQYACHVGLDLASKTDIAAKAIVFRVEKPAPVVEGEPEREPETHYYGFVQSYLPEDAVTDGRNSQYEGWELEGRLKTTPGDVLDFAVVKADILSDHQQGRILECAFDPWQATQLSQELQEEGLTCIEVRPNVQNFSAPMKEIDALVRSRRFHHDGNPVLRWMVSNVTCHEDAKGNIYPRKQNPENKIDGVVALLMAMNRSMLAPDSSPYTATRGLLSL